MEGFICRCRILLKKSLSTSVRRGHSWLVLNRSNQGQANVEVLVVALGLFAIILVPVTAEEQTVLEIIELIVTSWMFVFSVTWQQFLLHPWAA